MEIYPALSVKPSVSGFGHEPMNDPCYRSDPKDGALLVKTRTSAVPIRQHLDYPAMPDADKDILEAWEVDNIGYGGLRFEWTNPRTEKVYIAILLGPIDYQLEPNSGGNLWIVSLDIGVIREK